MTITQQALAKIQPPLDRSIALAQKRLDFVIAFYAPDKPAKAKRSRKR